MSVELDQVPTEQLPTYKGPSDIVIDPATKQVYKRGANPGQWIEQKVVLTDKTKK